MNELSKASCEYATLNHKTVKIALLSKEAGYGSRDTDG